MRAQLRALNGGAPQDYVNAKSRFEVHLSQDAFKLEASCCMTQALSILAMNRAQFYCELWTFTGQELRIRYALNPYGLSVICDQYRLPVPPMGYWVKVRHGKRVARRPLPDLADPALQTIHLLLLEPDATRCKLSHQPIPVNASLRDPHPLVVAVQRACGASDHPKLFATAGIAVEISVPQQSLERAMLLLDALIKAFEAGGGEIFGDPKGTLWGRQPDGVGLAIRAGENLAAPDVSPRLTLSLTTNRQIAVKSHWSDGKGKVIEGSLRPVVNSIFESVARIRWDRLDQECVSRQAQKIAAVRAKQIEQQAIAGDLR